MRLSIRNTKHAYVKRLCLRCNQKINVVLNSICVNSAERVMMNRISFITNPIEWHTEWAAEQYNNNIYKCHTLHVHTCVGHTAALLRDRNGGNRI